MKQQPGQPSDGMPPHVARNIEELVRLEGRDRQSMGRSDHFADFMTKFGGSMVFVWLHVGWFAIWSKCKTRRTWSISPTPSTARKPAEGREPHNVDLSGLRDYSSSPTAVRSFDSPIVIRPSPYGDSVLGQT